MRLLVLLLLLAANANAAPKPKVITFGRWTSVQWMVGSEERQAITLRVRPLLVNGEIKEFTVGELHDVTDRVFVVQRALKVNDRLPHEDAMKPQWTWRPAGWIMVDRSNAHITKLTLPEYDALSSSPVWFRDYVAYCGVNDSGDKLYAVVFQIGRRKPVLKKLLGGTKNTGEPNGECSPPTWQRQPVRVTFNPAGSASPVSFEIRNFATEIPPDTTPPVATDDVE